MTDPTVALAAAETKLTKALSAVPDHARAHLFLGFVDIFTRRAEEGIAECEHALALDRNLANAHSMIGVGKIFSGRAEEAEAHIGEALRVSPRDTMAYNWMAFAGLAQLHLGSWEQGVAWFRRAIEANRNYPLTYFWLAAALAQLGRLDEARLAVKAGLALNSTFADLPRPLRLDGDYRQPHPSGPARAHFRRHAQGRGPRTMTAARRLAAILAADVGIARQKPRQRRLHTRKIGRGHQAGFLRGRGRWPRSGKVGRAGSLPNTTTWPSRPYAAT